MEMKEGQVKIQVAEGVFYNPAMHFSRDLFTLAASVLPDKLRICDGFTASGIRGLRYAKENSNAERVVLVDWSERAITTAKRNITLNKLGKKASAEKAELRKFLMQTSSHRAKGKAAAAPPFNFIELDPFGTPVPFLWPALFSFHEQKSVYLSVTATDPAVLCGAHAAACWKNYQAKPLNNEVCHETGLRILLGKIVRTAAEFNYYCEPLISLSHRHYFKVLVRLRQGAEKSVEDVKSLGYFEECSHCLRRRLVKFPTGKKCTCGCLYEYAGPLWLGDLHQREHLRLMAKENEKRDCQHKREIRSLLSVLEGELGLPWFYDLHVACKRLRIPVSKTEAVVQPLRKKGYRVSPTHYISWAIKTDAPWPAVKAALIKAARSAKTKS